MWPPCEEGGQYWECGWRGQWLLTLLLQDEVPVLHKPLSSSRALSFDRMMADSSESLAYLAQKLEEAAEAENCCCCSWCHEMVSAAAVAAADAAAVAVAGCREDSRA